jgi:hypothetical protein
VRAPDRRTSGRTQAPVCRVPVLVGTSTQDARRKHTQQEGSRQQAAQADAACGITTPSIFYLGDSYPAIEQRSCRRKRLRPWRKPGPGPRVSARAAPRPRKYRRAARLGCNGAQWSPVVRQQQPRALLEDTGLQSRPTTDGSTETPTTDPHVCVKTVQSPACLQQAPGLPGPRARQQPSLLRAPTTNLRGPAATPAPCGVICYMLFATGVDKAVLTRCVQHLPPWALPAELRRPHERIHQGDQQDQQLANARVAEADAPSHHHNRSKPRELLAIQQGGVISIASESK